MPATHRGADAQEWSSTYGIESITETVTRADQMKKAGERPKAARPVHTVRYGAVKAAVWRNLLDDENVIYNVTVSLSYRTRGENPECRESVSFGSDLFLPLAKVLSRAHTRIHERLRQDREQQGTP